LLCNLLEPPSEWARPGGACSAPTEPTGETVAGRAPPGHSNRADRRENQGLCAKLQFIGKLLTFLLSWSFFILRPTQKAALLKTVVFGRTAFFW